MFFSRIPSSGPTYIYIAFENTNLRSLTDRNKKKNTYTHPENTVIILLIAIYLLHTQKKNHKREKVRTNNTNLFRSRRVQTLKTADEQSSVELVDFDEEERAVFDLSGYHDKSSQFEMSAHVL